jgi:hypothetical protein
MILDLYFGMDFDEISYLRIAFNVHSRGLVGFKALHHRAAKSDFP